jgi:hypothetical protein
MRISIILLLILLAVSACVSRPGETPGAAVTPSGASSGTSSAECACPTSMVTPAQPQGGTSHPASEICNCPAILVTPPLPTAGVETTPPAVPTEGITLADNGKTFIVHPGDRFLLNLGMDFYDWTVNIDNQNVLARVKNIMVIHGAQGIFEASSLGEAVLTAIGDPLCRKSTPACAAPSILFKIMVLVQ